MMRLTTTKAPSRIKGVEVYYVTSETNPSDPPYIVTKVPLLGSGSNYFCQCEDFFVRKLPHIGTPLFSLCKHAKFVRDTKSVTPRGSRLVAAYGGVIRAAVKKARVISLGYRVWVKADPKIDDRQKPRPSRDIPNLFTTKAGAERAIKEHAVSLPRSQYIVQPELRTLMP